MDPDATLRRLLEAISREDPNEAHDALRDLMNWIAFGGFLPTDAARHALAGIRKKLGNAP